LAQTRRLARECELPVRRRFAAPRFGPGHQEPQGITIEWPLANANPRSGFVSLANSFNFDDLVDILQH